MENYQIPETNNDGDRGCLERENSMTPVIMIDMVWKGHVPTYHKYFAQVLLESGHSVLSICPEPAEVAAWISKAVPHLNRNLICEPFNSSRNDSGALRQRTDSRVLKALKLLYRSSMTPALVQYLFTFFLAVHLWRKTNRMVSTYTRKHNLPVITLVFFPYIDFRYQHDWLFPFILDRLFRFRWAALYLHPTFLRKSTSHRLRCSPDVLFTSDHCTGISILDETLLEPLRKRIGKPVVWFPDVTDGSVPHRISNLGKDILRRAEGKKIVSLIGVISQKKNLTTLLRTADLCLKRQLPYFFIVAGEIDLPSWSGSERRYIESVIGNRPGNVYFHLKSISDGAEYNSLYAISNIIYAVYTSFYHSSNTLTKAAILGKPVIVSDGCLMAERVKKFGTGLSVPNKDVDKCLEAIIHISRNVDFDGLPLQAQFAEYSALHSLQSLRESFGQLLAKVRP